jgi:hypothetical protein
VRQRTLHARPFRRLIPQINLAHSTSQTLPFENLKQVRGSFPAHR